MDAPSSDDDSPPAKRLRPDEPAACQFADDPRLEREHANAKGVIRGVAQEFVCPIDQTPVYDAVLAAAGRRTDPCLAGWSGGPGAERRPPVQPGLVREARPCT